MDDKDRVIVALALLLVASFIIAGVGVYVLTRPRTPVPPPDPCYMPMARTSYPYHAFDITVSTDDPNVLLHPETQEATIYPFETESSLTVSVKNLWICPDTARFFVSIASLADIKVTVTVIDASGDVRIIASGYATSYTMLSLNPGEAINLNFFVEQVPVGPVPLDYPSGYVRPIAGFGLVDGNIWTLMSEVPSSTPGPLSG